MQYTYGAQGGTSQYIGSITDKAGEVTILDWYFQDVAAGTLGAYKIMATAPDGVLQTFDRSFVPEVPSQPEEPVVRFRKLLVSRILEWWAVQDSNL